MSSGTLVNKETGEEIKIGTRLTRDGETVTLIGWRAPHKISSTGAVFVQPDNDTFERKYFPSVYGLEIINHDFD